MNVPSPNQPLSRDSVLSVLRAAGRPLSVAQIATRLEESNVVGVFQSGVRSILYGELLPRCLAQHDSSYRWTCTRQPSDTGIPISSAAAELRKTQAARRAAVRKTSKLHASVGIVGDEPTGRRATRRTCERCGGRPVSGERFCRKCRKEMLNELSEAGYLTAQVRGHVGDQRTTEMRENVDETKHGKWHG